MLDRSCLLTTPDCSDPLKSLKSRGVRQYIGRTVGHPRDDDTSRRGTVFHKTQLKTRNETIGEQKPSIAAWPDETGDRDREALNVLAEHGFNRRLAKQALEIARQRGRFTIFSLVDALTRLSGEMKFAGDRMEVDQKASA